MGVPKYRDYSNVEGRELSARAFADMARKGKTDDIGVYREALEQVWKEDARSLRRYQDDWPSASERNADVTGAEAYRDIGNFVIEASRRRDGTFDATKAAEAVNGVFDPKVVFNAVGHVINTRAMQIASNMSPGLTNANLSVGTRRAITELGALAPIYNSTVENAQMSPDALTVMYPSNRWV